MKKGPEPHALTLRLPRLDALDTVGLDFNIAEAHTVPPFSRRERRRWGSRPASRPANR